MYEDSPLEKSATKLRHFNIRVYGIVLNEKMELLLSDEFRMNMKMTKFPGGGLRFGEGPADCIKREAIEEFGQEIEIIEHFYTTDFFQKALFYEDHQLISIYYRIQFIKPVSFKISDKPFDFLDWKEGNQSFRWADVKTLKPEVLTFPIDQKVASILNRKYQDFMHKKVY